MLNIISKSYCHSFVSGPQKVVRNLIKGLDLIGYPYVINRQLDACQRLWIHDDLRALKQLGTLDPKIKVIVGPNLVVMPRHLPDGVDLSRVVYLHPSAWAKRFWEEFGFRACPIEAWPTGIDTQEFTPRSGSRDRVVIYFKERFPEELAYVEALLKEKKTAYQVLRYPRYANDEYKRLLSRTRYLVWIGRQESQGIALQEAMAADIPILIWDVPRMGHWLGSEDAMAHLFTEPENNFTGATSAEYFDESCGIKIKDRDAIANELDRMESQWTTFHPRHYIETHLSLEKQARDLVNFYQKYFGLTFEQGKSEQLRHSGRWINSTLPARLYFLLQDVRRTLQRKINFS